MQDRLRELEHEIQEISNKIAKIEEKLEGTIALRKLSFDDSYKALETAIQASNRAIEVAKESMEKRLDSMNEFRDQLKDQASRFPTRGELWSFVSTAMFIAIGIATLITKFF